VPRPKSVSSGAIPGDAYGELAEVAVHRLEATSAFGNANPTPKIAAAGLRRQDIGDIPQISRPPAIHCDMIAVSGPRTLFG
jgi:hypothetical protein